jgi:thiol:disulfide interchange protein DsbA
MNCETIDSILDERRTAQLRSPERQRAAEHMGSCARCAAAWGADDVLRSETIADPPPELFATMLQRIAVAPAEPRAAAARGRRLALAAFAATITLVAIIVRLPLPPRDAGQTAPVVQAPSATTAAPRFVAGRHYEVLRGGAPLDASAEPVTVTEFFMFVCGPCYVFEPELVRWSEQTRSRVSVNRVPALFSPLAELHARAFYTAAALGKLDAMHAAFFDEIHVRGNPLASVPELEQFFARFGVDEETFSEAFGSAAVNAELERAAALNRAYNIRATPSLVVAGRYSTNPSLAGSAMLAVIDQLVAEVEERRGPIE